MKVFKFKKYKEGYEDERHGVSLRYPLEIGSFLRSEDQDPPESSTAPAAVEETFLNALSSCVAFMTISSPPTAIDAGRVAQVALEEAALLAPTFEESYKDKVSV